MNIVVTTAGIVVDLDSKLLSKLIANFNEKEYREQTKNLANPWYGCSEGYWEIDSYNDFVTFLVNMEDIIYYQYNFYFFKAKNQKLATNTVQEDVINRINKIVKKVNKLVIKLGLMPD